jgi:hypothetical protein
MVAPMVSMALVLMKTPLAPNPVVRASICNGFVGRRRFSSAILFLLSGGSDPVLPGFGPVGFRPRLRSISSDGIYGNLGTQIVSLLLEIDFTLRPIFPFTSLLTTLFTTYYIYYVLYIYF